jgi:hypothetical protein
LQTCSHCFTQSPDSALVCPSCQADLRDFSVSALTLKKFQANPRVSLVRIAVAEDACSSCQSSRRTYPKDQVPALPHEGCSHEHGCRCTYQPVLNQMYP